MDRMALKAKPITGGDSFDSIREWGVFPALSHSKIHIENLGGGNLCRESKTQPKQPILYTF